MGGQSMPRGKREQADQIILKLREAELELSRGNTVLEAANLGWCGWFGREATADT